MERLNTRLNANQLRNLWLRRPEERLEAWRNFRIYLQEKYKGASDSQNDVEHCLEEISAWWKQAPMVSLTIDPYDHNKWPKIWEIIYQGECCKYSKALAIAYNAFYVFDEDDKIMIDLVYDNTFGDEYMVANYNNQFFMNMLHGDIVRNIDNKNIIVKSSIRVSKLLK